MTTVKLTAGCALLALAAFVPTPLIAQGEAEQQLGNVHFATSCNDTAQRRFDRAMRYQHSFWYRASQEIFEETLKADPSCAIAYWGIALSLWNNPHNAPPAPNLPLALAAIQKAKAADAKTPRERDFIDALAVMYVDYDKIGHGPRVQAYTKAMEAVAQRYPDDDEAQILYAIALNVSASPADKTYAQQLKGAAILEPIWQRQPQHPGIAHYLIHLYDYPAIAAQGVEAANRYAKIAPAAPHAQHMPSHIFTRIGYWNESIKSNLAAVQAAKADQELSDQMHGWDYLVYAYLQLGEDSKAAAVVDEMAKLKGWSPAVQAPNFASAASPARYTIERGDWAGAAALGVQPGRFNQTMALTHFARALGAARSGNPDAAKPDIAKLAELRDKLRAAQDPYWAEQVDIQHQVATAWAAFAHGQQDEGLKLMSAAADAEDKTEKSPVTPGSLAPARELYGDMLLERGMAREALAAYEATQAKEPNRFHAFAGAAKAAAQAADAAKARANYEKLVKLAGGSDRPDIVDARQYLAKN